VEPTAIYAAGDLSDPHGTHRKCLEILIHIFNEEEKKVKENPNYKSLFPPAKKFFLYRGAWKEW
jgi:glucosamine-6-phosphate deaminase